MIHKNIKQELDELKEIVRIDMNVNHKISYGDVIKYLIANYKKTLKATYPLSQKLLVGRKIENQRLNVIIPLRKSFGVSSKLDEKTRVSFSLES